jgi:valyl-tRNA synthetase
MATNSGSSNPIGERTGPVTDPAPPISPETLSAVKTSASADIIAHHRQPNGGQGEGEKGQGREKEDVPGPKGPGLGDEIVERTK